MYFKQNFKKYDINIMSSRHHNLMSLLGKTKDRIKKLKNLEFTK